MGRKSNFPLEPSLVYCYDKYQTFRSLSEPHKIYRKRIAALSGDSKIVAHSCGWFLLSSQRDTHFSLWNPTISDSCSFIHLPPLSLNPDSEISDYLLSSPPGDPDCKVLLLDEVFGSIIFIRPGDPNKEWTHIQYQELLPPDSECEEHIEGEGTIDCLLECVSCNGKLYGFTCPLGKLLTLSIDNANELVIESVCKMPDHTPKSTVGYVLSRTSDRLVDCCGELLYLHFEFSDSKGNQLIEAHVFKFDSVGMVWKRAESLMGQAVFLDAIGASSFNPALFGKGIQADSLYFTHFNGQGLLYNFNVTDGSTSVTLPCPSVPSGSSSPPKIFVPPHVWLSRNNTLPCGKEEQAQDFDEKEDSNIVQAEGTHFLDLPLETLVLIAHCLNPFDYLNFRATCRDCRLIPRLQQRQALHMFKTCHYSSSPMWMLHSINDMTAFKFIDPIRGTSFIMNVPESLNGCAVRYSRNGWLLMSDGESSMFFINLFTDEIIKLPETPTRECARLYAMAFSSLPTSPDCIVVGSLGFCGFPFEYNASVLRIAVITMGGLNEWTGHRKVLMLELGFQPKTTKEKKNSRKEESITFLSTGTDESFEEDLKAFFNLHRREPAASPPFFPSSTHKDEDAREGFERDFNSKRE
ncbi:F-box/kelch-repeat protein [Senna tora]|uniref:F-box/kelch-repeat protein n=1 Tax=Senna tora TaxID=362788 RepID=A0A834WQL5_9FABA|nr:F-box/kelch-repeat protein [Senna tora]